MFGSMEYMELGPVPCNESCAQVGSDEYQDRAKAECRRYKALLEKTCPVPEGVEASYAIKRFPHEFGSYYEVVVKYNPNNEAACNFAFEVEGNTPHTWKG